MHITITHMVARQVVRQRVKTECDHAMLVALSACDNKRTTKHLYEAQLHLLQSSMATNANRLTSANQLAATSKMSSLRQISDVLCPQCATSNP